MDKAEVLAHPQNQLFAEAADVHHGQAGCCGELNRKVAVTHGVQAVLADLRQALCIHHTERARDHFAVQRVAGAGQCGGAQRQAVDTAAHVGHPFGVAAEHLDVGQHVVAKTHGLRHLQVGEAGQDDLHVFLGNVHQRFLQVHQQPVDEVDLTTQPQAHVGGDLVVAAAAGVQAFASVTHQLGQTGLDVQVYVFQVQLPFKCTGQHLGRDLRHAALDGCVVFGVDDALGGQHTRVCQ